TTPASAAADPPAVAAAEEEAADGGVGSVPSPPSMPTRAPSSEGPAATGDAVAAQPPVLSVEAGGNPRGRHRSGDPDWHGEHFSNATHRSTTDPAARLYRKSKGQESKLRYLGHYMADLPSGVIYGAMATQATGTAEREADRKSVV